MNEAQAIEYFNKHFTVPCDENKHGFAVINDYEGITRFIRRVFNGEMSLSGYRQKSPIEYKYITRDDRTLKQIAEDEQP